MRHGDQNWPPSPVMQYSPIVRVEWETQILDVPVNMLRQPGGHEYIQRELDRLGADGWELVKVSYQKFDVLGVDSQLAERRWYYFKRPRVENGEVRVTVTVSPRDHATFGMTVAAIVDRVKRLIRGEIIWEVRNG